MMASLLPPNSNSPNLVALSKLLSTWGGPQKILVQAYGNFQVQKVMIPQMLQKLWEFSVAIREFEMRNAPSFAQAYSLLVAQSIPSLPQCGIVVWLICCDLAEYGLCHDPTATDLAKHMLGKKSKPSGPTKGLEVVGRMAGEEPPLDSVEGLAEVFEEVMAVLAEPDEELHEAVTLMDDCEILQDRKLSIADLEHGLCKMAREDRLRYGTSSISSHGSWA
jgi:hypothetical protein